MNVLWKLAKTHFFFNLEAALVFEFFPFHKVPTISLNMTCPNLYHMMLWHFLHALFRRPSCLEYKWEEAASHLFALENLARSLGTDQVICISNTDVRKTISDISLDALFGAVVFPPDILKLHFSPFRVCLQQQLCGSRYQDATKDPNLIIFHTQWARKLSALDFSSWYLKSTIYLWGTFQTPKTRLDLANVRWWISLFK